MESRAIAPAPDANSDVDHGFEANADANSWLAWFFVNPGRF